METAPAGPLLFAGSSFRETERVLRTNGRVPTQLFNGYAEFVADI